jgi:succinoglycan biosynthesis transport protein ExoP
MPLYFQRQFESGAKRIAFTRKSARSMTAWTAPPPRRAGPADAVDGAALPTADVGELVRVASRRLRLLLPCLAIAGAIALAYIALAPSRYAATMSILVDPRERVPVGLDAQAMPQTPDIALVESEMSILTSRTVLRRVAEVQNLVDDPEFRPGLIGLLVGSLTSLWRTPAGDPDARLDAVVVTLGGRISVKRSERSYIADVEVRAATPAKAEHLAQGLADAYFAEQAALSDEVVAKQSAWLDARIAELQPRVQEAERRAQAYREANAIVLSDGRISPEQQLKDANHALVIARGKRGEVEAAYEQVKAALNASAAGGEGVGEAQHSPVIEKLRADQAALARDEAYELSTLGPRHPSYLTTRAQLLSVQTQIDAEVRRIRSASERDLKAARAAEQGAAKLVASLEATNQQFGGTRIELDRLNAEAAALRAAYEKSLSARENVRRDIVESPHSAVVDPPAAAPGRVNPRVGLALFLALVGALNLWLVAVFAAEYRDRRRGSAAAIPSAPPAPSAPPTPAAAATSAPPAAEAKANASTREAPPPAPNPFAINFAIPAFAPRSDGDSESDGGAALAAAEAAMVADASYAAAINALRDRLTERLADGAHAPVVAIVSRDRGDGASTIALSLAHALSVTGRRVLLVDCDHRRPTLSAYARRLRKVIVDSPGKVASILRRDAVSGGEALILPLGGPGQAVLSARLHARFDWVVLDCGPLAGADALLAHEKTADAAVIVDAATTDAAGLEAAAERAGIGGLVAGVARTPAKQPGRTA